MLASTQPARSVTRARAGPASDRRPVVVGDELLGLRRELVEVGLRARRSGTTRRTARGRRPGRRRARPAPSRRRIASRRPSYRSACSLAGTWGDSTLTRYPTTRGRSRRARPGPREHRDPVVPDLSRQDHESSIGRPVRIRCAQDPRRNRPPVGAWLVVEAVGDPLPQRGRARVSWHFAGDHHAQLGLEVEGLEARRAVVEVVLDACLRARPSSSPSRILVELMQCVVAVSHALLGPRVGRSPSGHRTGRSFGSGSSTSPRATANSYNCFCSAFLPRCSRLITVPIGMSRISAISL